MDIKVSIGLAVTLAMQISAAVWYVAQTDATIKDLSATVAELSSANLRNYRYKNILAFGDLLHKLHPLAGQGFNMIIRDIQCLIDLINFRKKHGLELDSSICSDFEKKTKHTNYLFSTGVDLVYEFFNLESRVDNKIISKSLQFLGKNKIANEFFIKLADRGITT